MELVEKIVTNPVTLGATAVAIGTAADAVAQSSTVPEDRKTCARRLTAWSDKLKREHKHLHTAMLTVHSLVSGALFSADVGTDALATAEIRAQFGHDAWQWKLMAAFIALPIVLMWLGLVRLVWKKRHNGYGDRYAEDFEEARKLYGPTLLTVVFGLPVVPLLDVLMLLLKVPGIGDALRSRLPNDSKSTITNNFMNTYGAARTLVETFVESLPQLAIQVYIASIVSIERGSGEVRLLLPSIALSFFDFAWVFANNLFAARRSGRSLLQHFAMLLRIGGGAFENGVNAIYGNMVASVDLSELELNEEHARQVVGALRNNTALTWVNLLQNRLGDGAAAIVAAAKRHDKIKTLCGIKEGNNSASFRGLDLKAPDVALLSFDLEVNRALTALDLCWTSLSGASENIARAVLQHPRMEVFCNIPMKDMREDSLIELGLPEQRIGAHGAIVIASLLQFSRSLTTLDLGENDIGGQYVKEAELTGTTFKVGDIVQWNGMEVTILKATDPDDGDIFVQFPQGIQAIAEALKVHEALTSINLLKNDLGNGAAAIVAAAKQNGNIKTLCGIEEGKVEVDWKYSGIGKPLKALDAALLSFDLESNMALTSVNLLKNDLGDAAAAIVAAAKRNGNIKTLCGIEEGETEVDLSNTGLLSSDAALLSFDLEFNSALTTLNLASNDIGVPDGWSIRIEVADPYVEIRKYEHIDGSIQTECPQGASSGVIALAESLEVNRALTALDVSGNPIGDRGKSAIGDALLSSNTSKLHSLSCSEWSIKANVTSLDLTTKRLNTADAKLLAGVIKFNRALKSIDFSYNEIADGGAAALSEAVQSNSTLEELKLIRNEIGAAGAKSLANMLEFSRALKSVDLRSNRIPEEGKKRLRDAVDDQSIALLL